MKDLGALVNYKNVAESYYSCYQNSQKVGMPEQEEKEKEQ